VKQNSPKSDRGDNPYGWPVKVKFSGRRAGTQARHYLRIVKLSDPEVELWRAVLVALTVRVYFPGPSA